MYNYCYIPSSDELVVDVVTGVDVLVVDVISETVDNNNDNG
jgi:hypothetical protein